MTDSITPPKLATLLLSLFKSEPDFPQIEGDLSEEFHNHLLTSNPQMARRLYWRDTFRNLWALAKRMNTIQVFGIAALSVGVSVFSPKLFLDWLFYVGAPVYYALTLLLLFVFEATIVSILGILMSLLLRGRERMLRLAFSGFYLLYIMIMSGYLLINLPFLRDIWQFRLNIIGWSLTLIAFWMGSVWVSKRSVRQRAA